MSDETGFTDWEYFALYRQFRWTPAQIDEMPEWLVHHLLAAAR
jgi:hypothetical protein